MREARILLGQVGHEFTSVVLRLIGINCIFAIEAMMDPGTDQQTLTSAGYLGGKRCSLSPGSKKAFLFTFRAMLTTRVLHMLERRWATGVT
jgi:hypothetical protein